MSYKTEQQDDSTLDKGLTKIKKIDNDEQRKIVVEKTYNNKQAINRKIINDTVVTEPVNEIIIVRTKEKDITLTYLCPASYDRNKACDDTVYNSDLDAAYLVIKACDLSICQNEGHNVG
ncbi:G5 domain-containing protein [Erysipelothrix amsterdamensis]|uniref:G5 domain-containing protein n=1 Tax=Erysipelothrix amsterdamensis TaxID=2929157 RepID=UPI00345FC5FF